MRIKDFSWTHTIGKRPDVELSLFDVTSDELTTLRDLATKGDKIRIEPIEYSKPVDFGISDLLSTSSSIDIRPVTITPNDIMNYARRDAEMAATLFGRSKIEFTPRDIKVKKVIFNKPATIIFWSDNTKTVVVCGKDDTYDKEKGFFIACAKKLFGNDYKAVGRMNKALEKAIIQTKEVEDEGKG